MGKRKDIDHRLSEGEKLCFSTLSPSLSMEMTKQHRLRFSQMQFSEKNIKRSAAQKSTTDVRLQTPFPGAIGKRTVDIYRSFLRMPFTSLIVNFY